MKAKKGKVLYVGIGVILGAWLLSIIYFNLSDMSFEKLNQADQQALSEYSAYYSADSKAKIWKDFDLEQKTILAIDKSSKKAFLINPKNKVNGLFARQISMPNNQEIKAYEIFRFYPGMSKFLFDGNFNTLGKTYKFLGNEVFFIKYDEKSGIQQQYTSLHFITFLSHEAFHYYMQDQWALGGNIESGLLSEEDINLISQQYEVLTKIQEMLIDRKIDKTKIAKYMQEYVDIVDVRIKKNKVYVEAELDKETIEGTATYVGIKASNIVQYDFGVMYFDNKKNVLFREVIPMLKAGGIDESFLMTRMPYETGALLCLVMDELEIPNWQEKLNDQTASDRTTLFAIIKDFIS